MVSNAKLYRKLDALEIQLEQSLVPHLRNAAAGNNDLIFCVKSFNQFSELKHRTDKLTEELIDIGSLILGLKSKLGEHSDGGIAERICWYCREWGNAHAHNRSAAKDLAQQFLLEIEDAKRNES